MAGTARLRGKNLADAITPNTPVVRHVHAIDPEQLPLLTPLIDALVDYLESKVVTGEHRNGPCGCGHRHEPASGVGQRLDDAGGVDLGVELPFIGLDETTDVGLQHSHNNLLTLHGLSTRHVAAAALLPWRWLQRKAWGRQQAGSSTVAPGFAAASEVTPLSAPQPDGEASR